MAEPFSDHYVMRSGGMRKEWSGEQRYIVLFWPHLVINDAYLHNTIQITSYLSLLREM